ncbi:MAG TPA: lysylphosphatidylglycerol synthase transmembrane domain-containing protein [Stellaceae bacterium]|nr:lysylphosphatidylglycerol synthase transmembrane domain-containing protein [Stellaceae bacterium]
MGGDIAGQQSINETSIPAVLQGSETKTTAQSGRRKGLVLLLKVAMSAAVIIWLVQKVGIENFWRQLSNVGILPLAVALLLTVLQTALGSLRWCRILAKIGCRMRIPDAFRIFYVAAFFSTLLPSSVGGDFVRAWGARAAGLTLAKSINSVVLDRISTLLGLMVLILALFAPLTTTFGWRAYAFPVLALAAFGGLGVIMLMDRLPARYGQWRIVRGFWSLSGDCRRVYLRPWAACEIIGVSAIVAILMSLSVYVLARGLNIPIGIFDCLLIVPSATLVTALPISIAGWGLREASFVFAFGFIGVTASSALSLSVLFGLVNLVSTLPGGIFWLFDRRAKS